MYVIATLNDILSVTLQETLNYLIPDVCQHTFSMKAIHYDF